MGRFSKEKCEDGRLVSVKREHRYCKLCEYKKVEDETHFLITCKRLKVTRDMYIKQLLQESPETRNMSDTCKVKWLLDRENIKRAGDGIEALFKTRQSLVFDKV